MALKVGIVGARGIGTKHAECYSKDGLAKLVGICDLIPARGEALAKAHKVPAYRRLRDLLDAVPDLDIVDVSTGGLVEALQHHDADLVRNGHLLQRYAGWLC